MNKTEMFWTILRKFNEDTLPVQILLILLSLFALYGVFAKPSKASDKGMTAFLAAAFAWNGIACFLLYCGKSPMALFVGGPLYLVISFLFLIDLLVTGKCSYRLPDTPLHQVLVGVLLLCVYLFPFAGMALGHGFVVLPMFPCPLAGFALILFSAAPRMDRDIFILLLVWAFVNIPKCFGLFGCYEEIVLCASGFYSLYVVKTRATTRKTAMEPLHEPV